MLVIKHIHTGLKENSPGYLLIRHEPSSSSIWVLVPLRYSTERQLLQNVDGIVQALRGIWGARVGGISLATADTTVMPVLTVGDG